MDREPHSGKPPQGPVKVTLILAMIFVSPLLLPFSSVNGEPRLESSDFGVLDELNDMLGERKSFLEDNSVSPLADSRIDAVRDSVTSSDPDLLSTYFHQKEQSWININCPLTGLPTVHLGEIISLLFILRLEKDIYIRLKQNSKVDLTTRD